MTGGTPSDRAQGAAKLCEGASDDFRALLAARVGAVRARKATQLFFASLAQSLDETDKETANKRSVDERISEHSMWSSAPWHVLKVEGKCMLFHVYEGNTTTAGLPTLGTTIEDILIADHGHGPQVLLTTPGGGSARSLAPYSGKKVSIVFELSKSGFDKEYYEIDNVAVSQSGDYYLADLGPISSFEMFDNFDRMEIHSINHDASVVLAGYRYDVSGMREAVAALRRCM